MITVWLPSEEFAASVNGLPDGFRADVWTGSQLPDSAAEVEVVCPPFDIEPQRLDVLADLPRLRVVQLESVGADWVLPYLPAGVTLCNARGAYDNSVAEWVIAVALAHQCALPAFSDAQRAARWMPRVTGSLEGAQVLIVGFGSIGRQVARLLEAFGAATTAVAAHARDGVQSTAALPDLLPGADIVVLLTPNTPSTRGMVDATFLARMQDNALLINAGRGTTVDGAALATELFAGRLRAALDVTDPEPLPADHVLWSAPGVILTPHVAGSNGRPPARAATLLRAQLHRYAQGRPLTNVVGPEGY